MRQYRFTLILTVVTLAMAGLLLFSYQSPDASFGIEDVISNHGQATQVQRAVIMKSNDIQWSEKLEYPPLREVVIQEKTEAFIDILLQEIDDDYKVKGILTKEDLVKEFSPVVTTEAVYPYVDFYYQELDDGLYIVPTELPPWFVPGEPYEIIELENGNVLVEQENEIDLYGKYRIIIEFSYEKDWRIVRIEHPPVNENQLDII